MKKGFFVVLFSVLLSGLTAYGVVKASNKIEGALSSVTDGEKTQQGFNTVKTVNLAESDYPDFTYAAEAAVQAVVYVEVTVKMRQQYQQIDPFFRFFFGDEYGYGQPQSREQKGSGSGVIIRPDGYIVTNNHVVENATSIKVTLNDNHEYDATVIGTDPATDVAIIKVNAENLPTIPFGDSDQLRLGEWVLAIGSPLSYNLRSTITAGIVSAKGRSMPNSTGEFKIESFIQTDAAVNPGNSGGALVNKKGELVGINTAIISQTGSYSGYSFAVPVNIVRKVVEDLIDFGSVKRAVLGITMQPVDDKIAKEMKLSSTSGVIINEVSKGSAAEEAGLKKGDVLVAINGDRLTDGASVQEKVNNFRPGDTAEITYIRDGKQNTVPVTFHGTATVTGEVNVDGTTVFYGANLKAADAETLRAYGLRGGVSIVSVGSGKMAEAGARSGMIITYVNDEPVSKPEDVIAIAKKARRAVYIQCLDENGKSTFFGFGKE